MIAPTTAPPPTRQTSARMGTGSKESRRSFSRNDLWQLVRRRVGRGLLKRWDIRVGEDGQLVVDKSKHFQKELRQWDNAESFVNV
jgi:hypothetical protein